MTSTDGLGGLTLRTKERIAKMCFSVREAHRQFLECYRAGLADIAGPEWERDWKSWPQPKLSHVVKRLHTELRAACLESGMDEKTYQRYQRGGLNAVFIGIPFSFGKGISAKEIGEVQRLKGEFTGTEDEKTAKACREIQKRRNENTGRALLKSRTILPEPGESANLMGDLVKALANYLGRDDVREQVVALRLFKAVRHTLNAQALA